MEGVYEELDEAKAEIEKLREELKVKAELSESLKRRHNEQLGNAHEANSRIEKQAREIVEKDEEISALKETFGEVQRSLREKESTLNQLCAANEKLRAGCDEKLKRQKEESEGLASALEEANAKSFDQEQRIQACKEEIEGLKGCLSILQKKCTEGEKRDNRNKEARERDDAVLSLEEGKRKIEEQLKWKKEQFSHLEEAHRKTKAEFKASQKEWESEKSALLDELCSLQARLDSQIRISEDLQSRLQTCNQVLAREETRRKSLEAQLSDVQGRFENVFGDYQDTKSQLEILTEKREEIASLRHSLGKKESVIKEIEYQKRQLEQENEGLQSLVKEFQESQIQKASSGSPSVSKLQNRLKSSEQLHKESIESFKAKEAELNSQLKNRDEKINELELELKKVREDSANPGAKEAEKVRNDLSICRAELESRDVVIEELRMALENFQAREAEWKPRVETMTSDLEKKHRHELEKVTNDLSNHRLSLESRDATVKELEIELEQVRDREAEWKSRVETMMSDNEKKHKYELESRDQMIAKEAETRARLDKVANDLNNHRFLLESRDATVKELGIELEQVRDREAEWKSRVETMMSDLKRKDQAIEELKLGFEQQDEDHCAELRNKDAKIRALRDFIEDLKTREAEWTYQLEMCRSERDHRDAGIKELGVELESKDAKIKALGDFIEDLKTKEAEWAYRVEMIIGDLNESRPERDHRDARVEELGTDLESKDTKIKALGLELEQVQGDDRDARIKELEMDLENCHSLILQMKSQNEEISVMLLVLKNGIFDAKLRIAHEKAEINRSIEESEEKVSLLLVESSIREAFLREQVLEIESASRKKLNEAHNELAERIFEVHVWKSVAERFKVDLEESLETRRELEASLLAQVIFEESVGNEKRRLVCTVDERNERIADLEREIVSLESQISNFLHESLGREINEFVSSSVSFSTQLAEKQAEIAELRENMMGFIGESDDRIRDLSSADQNLMEMLESILRKDPSSGAKENADSPATTAAKSDVNSGMTRSPFREINH